MNELNKQRNGQVYGSVLNRKGRRRSRGLSCVAFSCCTIRNDTWMTRIERNGEGECRFTALSWFIKQSTKLNEPGCHNVITEHALRQEDKGGSTTTTIIIIVTRVWVLVKKGMNALSLIGRKLRKNRTEVRWKGEEQGQRECQMSQPGWSQ